MNLSRTAVMLIAVLVVLICTSIYLWLSLGLPKPEIDARIGSLRQSFTCEHCGNTFTMTTEDVGQMRRSRGQVFCPKCGVGGARKELNPIPGSSHGSAASQPAADRDAVPAADSPEDRSHVGESTSSAGADEDQSAVVATDQPSS